MNIEKIRIEFLKDELIKHQIHYENLFKIFYKKGKIYELNNEIIYVIGTLRNSSYLKKFIIYKNGKYEYYNNILFLDKEYKLIYNEK